MSILGSSWEEVPLKSWEGLPATLVSSLGRGPRSHGSGYMVPLWLREVTVVSVTAQHRGVTQDELP